MKTKTIKVPETLFRAAKIAVTGEGDKRTITLSISSDEPYLRYDWFNDEEYYEILSHSPGDVNEERLKAGLPVLFNHNRNDHLGRAVNYQNDGHKITLTGVNFSESDFAQAKMRDALNGVLVDSSVGYTVDSEGEAVGVKDGKPIYKFKWTPFEGSLVTVPADISVGVGRQRSIEGEGEPREILIREKNDSQNQNHVDGNEKPAQKRESNSSDMNTGNTSRNSLQFHNSDNGGGSGSGSGEGGGNAGATPTAEQQAANARAVANGIKAARDREREIRAIAARGNNVPDTEIERAVDEAVSDSGAVDRFRKFVFDNYWGNGGATPVRTPGEGDSRSTSNAGSSSGMQLRTPGMAFTASDDFKKIAKKGAGRGSRGDRQVAVEIADFSDFRTALLSGSRALLTGAGGADLANVQDLTTVVTTLQQRLTVADLLGQGRTDKGSIRYPQQTAYSNTTTTVVEGAAKPQVVFQFINKVATVAKIAGWTKLSNEVLEDFPFLQSVIDAQLPFMVQQTEEEQLLNGDGDDANILGLLNQTGILTQDIADLDEPDNTIPDVVLMAITRIRTEGFLEPDGIIMHPLDWFQVRVAKDANGQYYAGGAFFAPYGNGAFVVVDRMWGLPVVVTTAIAQGTALVGAFKIGAMVVRRSGLTVEMTNTDQDDFIKNLVTIRAEERVGLVVWRPKALCETTLGTV